MKKFFLFFATLLLPVVMISCGGDDEPSTKGGSETKNTTDVAVTGTVTELGAMYAQISGVVNLDVITVAFTTVDMGVEYSTQSTFQEKKRVSAEGLTGRSFSIRLSALRPETKYYYRTFVGSSAFSFDYYGEVKSFTTKKMTEANKYVDLGLPSGTLWATVNVGANSPDEYGYYFAWGETTPKEDYSWDTYKWCNGGLGNLTKYCTSSGYGTADNKTELDAADDAATANWGAQWRMPTSTQFRELLSECNWTWTSMNGVNGLLVSSKRNEKSLFLPAAGFRRGGSLYGAGTTHGGFWSRTLESSCPFDAFDFDFNSGLHFANRADGQVVRAVRVSQN